MRGTKLRMSMIVVAVALVGAALPSAVEAQVSEGAYFFEDFDDYTAGSGIMGQGGWDTWDSDPSVDAFVSNAQAFTSPNSLEIQGSQDVIHQFAYNSGHWYVYAKVYVPSNQTGDLFFIILNRYGHGAPDNNWSVQVRFSVYDGLVTNVGGTDNPGTGTLPLVTGQWTYLEVDINLDTGMYSVYYQDQLLETMSWSISGDLAISAFDLFSDGDPGTLAGYFDNIYLDTEVPVELTSFSVE